MNLGDANFIGNIAVPGRPPLQRLSEASALRIHPPPSGLGRSHFDLSSRTTDFAAAAGDSHESTAAAPREAYAAPSYSMGGSSASQYSSVLRFATARSALGSTYSWTHVKNYKTVLLAH